MFRVLEQHEPNHPLLRESYRQAMHIFLDAEQAFKRSQDLLGKKFISAASHDTVVARYNKAKAAMSGYKASIAAAQANTRAAEVNLQQTLIRAPLTNM